MLSPMLPTAWLTCACAAALLGSVAVPSAPLPSVPAPSPASSEVRTGVEFQVTPEQAVIYVNGKEVGTAAALGFHRLGPGSHTIRLVHGGDETEAEVVLEKGQVLTFVYQFDQ